MVGSCALCSGLCVLQDTGSVPCHQDGSGWSRGVYEMDELSFPLPHVIGGHYHAVTACGSMLATVELVFGVQGSQKARADV